ncbi:unnamed protein product [Bemisia tabaci]|uniref:D-aminoacyl-tRNA deacylase n=1 Tax=Bemisia tabaci TaxID=7038 RepID=A0A9P0AAR0_BEMTA|nr:PREDICTED: uncharacterized protein LOC109031112 isoform X1 [Bemisia tabaci]CAH0386657.1 unnamed protein product [Bemisia tabaci]
MRAVVQRVKGASVKVDGELISSVGPGLCVLVGIHKSDTKKDIDWLVNKLLTLKLFGDEGGKRWSKNVVDSGHEILCVSQFTLYYSLKGTKLDFHNAMPATQSQPFYEDFLSSLRTAYLPDRIKDGKFGAMMDVSLINDGPVTIQLDSPTQPTATSGDIS